MAKRLLKNTEKILEARKAKRFTYWLLVSLLVSFILITDVTGRYLIDFLKAHLPLKPLILVAFTAGLTWGAFEIHRQKLIRKSLTYWTLLLTLIIYSYIVLVDVRAPEETIHYVEFSVLAYLIYRGVFVDLSGLKGWLVTALLIGFFGWLAEFLQLYIPNRYYDLQDMVMNFLGSAFGILFTLIVLQEKIRFGRRKT